MPLLLSLDGLLFGLLAAAYLALRFGLPDFPQLVPDDLRAGALVTLMVGGYWLLDLLPRRSPLMQHIIGAGKYLAVAVTVIIVVVLPTILAINQRHQTAPYQFAHDGLMQSESATQFALAGRNPYIESYRDTPMGQWEFNIGGVRVNPGLEHYAYMPLTFVLPLPAQALAQQLWGWFDQRWVYLIFFAATLVLSTRLSRDPEKRLSLLIILALNPLFVPYFVEGRNDVLVLFWLMLLLILMQRQHWNIAAVVLALACATKQFAWLLVPFYLVYIAGGGSIAERLTRLKRPALLFGAVFVLAILPWLIGDPAAFLGDISYLQSSLSRSGYPVSGFSFGVLLLALQVVPSPTAPFPYWVFQLGIGLPLMLILLHRLAVNRDLRGMLIGYGLAWLGIFFFSQYFHDNHFGYVIAMMALAYFVDERVVQEVKP